MIIKKCPCCFYEMEFPLRKWIFKDLYTDSPPQGFEAISGKWIVSLFVHTARKNPDSR